MKYQLRAFEPGGDFATEIEFEAVELPRVLTRLTDFLRSVGFTYVNGMSVVSKGNDPNQDEWKYHNDDMGEYP